MATSSSPDTPQHLYVSPSQVPMERTDSDSDSPHTHSSRTPSNTSVDFPLLPDVSAQGRPSRSHAVTPSFVSSPLNPNAPAPGPPALFTRSRTQSRQSFVFNRVASEESQALTSQRSSLTPNRTSMILYRLAGEDEQRALSPPAPNRQSVLSNSGDSIFTVSYDSKYPSGAHTPHKLVPYPFDPSLHTNTPEDDDALHDPSDNTPFNTSSGIALRGLANVGVLIFVILALLLLFIFYPIWYFVVQNHSTVP
ncbi:hypothetical protein J3R82DRAFT_1564 [Butyriboletus roseoflavus]|nr:hypothetical protein J3R82DRAFT_1564 [Butyriboletus roseoflavus]